MDDNTNKSVKTWKQNHWPSNSDQVQSHWPSNSDQVQFWLIWHVLSIAMTLNL